MSAAEILLQELTERSVTVWQEAGQLRYRAPAGTVTQVVLANIRQHKPELLTLLQAANQEINGPFPHASRVRARQPDVFVLRFELDGRLATCRDPVSQTLAGAIDALHQQFPGRVGRIWVHDGYAEVDVSLMIKAGKNNGT